MLLDSLNEILKGNSLPEEQANDVMDAIMSGEMPPAQMAALLTALRMKGETIDEITGLARGMRNKAVQVQLPASLQAIDTCGTGGDNAGTFNISTAAAFVIASTGQPVAKHGNRAATSACGSADVLEALGVKIDLVPEDVVRCIVETGFGFMFAPMYHPAMKHVAPVRRELGFRTVFNILGPLTNPAHVDLQVLGVADPALVRPIAEALLRLGVQRALVVHGEDGLDEFSLATYTSVAEVDGVARTVREYRLHPGDVGLAESSRAELRGGTAAENAAVLCGILVGEITGPKSDVVCLNAGAALYVSGKASSIREGVALARSQLRPDGAAQTLGKYVALTQELARLRADATAAIRS